MRSHLFIHTGKKDFKCRLCGLEFRIFPSQLKHHRRKHPDEYIFHCALCNFSTNDVKENKRHDISLMHLNNTSGSESQLSLTSGTESQLSIATGSESRLCPTTGKEIRFHLGSGTESQLRLTSGAESLLNLSPVTA